MPFPDGIFTREDIEVLYEILQDETRDMWQRASRRLRERLNHRIDPNDIQAKFTSGGKD
jgi:hypothetical protein